MQLYRISRTMWLVNFILEKSCPSALVIVLSLFLYYPSNAYSEDYLTASGCSVSKVGYLMALAEEYEQRTGVKIFVRGGGSVVGIEDLRTGNADYSGYNHNNFAGINELLQSGAAGFFQKPFSSQDLGTAIKNALSAKK